ncbi:MAG: transcriptional regulator PpsR [Pseudomonadota bacterium]
MDASTARTARARFNSNWFAAADTSRLAELLSAAADIAIILDERGIVQDLVVGAPDMEASVFDSWIGSPLSDRVTVESQPKLSRLLKAANDDDGAPVQTHVNHPQQNADDLPIQYTSTALGNGCILALGRDLSPLAAAQRRFLSAQRAYDREYAKLRSAEARTRAFFHLADAPAFFVDEADRITIANRVAGDYWPKISRFEGRRFLDLFRPSDRDVLSVELDEARRSGSARSVTVDLGRLVLAPAGIDGGALLVRFAAGADRVDRVSDKVARLVEAMPDGFVVTDGQFMITAANETFAAMAEVGRTSQVVGSSLEAWLGRSGVDLSVIRTALADTGSLRGYATVVKSALGQFQDVEVSAARVSDARGEVIGLSIRPALAIEGPVPSPSAQQLTELVGRVPIKDIVRETTDRIEQMCIEAALELSGDNRASAAELLGLSRQSLYVKMRRYGIVDVDPDAGQSGGE